MRTGKPSKLFSQKQSIIDVWLGPKYASKLRICQFISKHFLQISCGKAKYVPSCKTYDVINQEVLFTRMNMFLKRCTFAIFRCFTGCYLTFNILPDILRRKVPRFLSARSEVLLPCFQFVTFVVKNMYVVVDIGDSR